MPDYTAWRAHSQKERLETIEGLQKKIRQEVDTMADHINEMMRESIPYKLVIPTVQLIPLHNEDDARLG